MIPYRLYIDNFSCHEKSFIDFTLFESALIVGNQNNNELYSNGVGKSTILKAIEFALFNESDCKLEQLIRDGQNRCQVVFDFSINDKLYRIVRKRSKTANDISLYERINEDFVDDLNIQEINKNIWKDISGRRPSDTEKDIQKLLKINYKIFRSIYHFVQDKETSTGIASVLPSKRKAIFKELLDLIVYSKLEKIAKDKYSSLIKDIDKHKVLLDNIGNPQSDIESISLDIIKLSELLDSDSNKILDKKNSSELLLSDINDIKNDIKLKEADFLLYSSQLSKTEAELKSLDNELSNYKNKKAILVKESKVTVEQLNLNKEELNSLNENLLRIDINEKMSKVDELKDKISSTKFEIQSIKNEQDELRIPLPSNSSCKHCRQTLTEEHRVNCQKDIDIKYKSNDSRLNSLNSLLKEFNDNILLLSKEIEQYSKIKSNIDSLSIKINSDENMLASKRIVYNEIVESIKLFDEKVAAKQNEIYEIKQKISSLEAKESDKLKVILSDKVNNHSKLSLEISEMTNEIARLSNNIAILKSKLEDKSKDLLTKEHLEKQINDVSDTASIYPDVIKAFSSSGIPNIMIQNVLNDLQDESNKLLSQFHLGFSLQLEFLTEKTRSDGDQEEALNIIYHLNGKERDFEQLSGAQKLAITFALKLGLAFLLQKMFDFDFKLLMLDEVDQSLDKAGVDAFSKIIKSFQKDFKILIITHNDRLKDKFSHAILVQQDRDLVSRAKVTTSW